MLSVVVQAGGESRRMGQDKALLPFLGVPLIQRVIERIRPAASEILVTTNHPEDYTFLGVALVGDLLPGTGALGGLYTALKAARYPMVAIVACDMPFASPDLLIAERKWLIEGDWDAVIPRQEEGTEPFHAVYQRGTCLPEIEDALNAGKRRVDSWFPQVRIRWVLPDELLPFSQNGWVFTNANTPDELKRAEAYAREHENIDFLSKQEKES